jgi:hypothetical protein
MTQDTNHNASNSTKSQRTTSERLKFDPDAFKSMDNDTINEMFKRIDPEKNKDEQFFSDYSMNSSSFVSKRQHDWINRTTSMKARMLQGIEDGEFEYEDDSQDIDFSNWFTEKGDG